MAKYNYHYRVHANMEYNQNFVHMQPTDPNLRSFTNLLWYGRDDEGYCVYRENPYSGDVVRIDFY